jgi:hypothetical protein
MGNQVTYESQIAKTSVPGSQADVEERDPDLASIVLDWAVLQRQVVELITVLYSISVWGVSHNNSACANCFISTLRSKLTSTSEGIQVAEYLADRDAEWSYLLESKGAKLREWTTSEVPRHSNGEKADKSAENSKDE